MKKLLLLFAILLCGLNLFAQTSNWSTVLPPALLKNYYSVHFVGNVGHAIGDTIFIRSTDGGASWITTCDTITGMTSINFTDNLTGYAVGLGAKIMKTTSGGLSWTTQTTSVSNLIPFSCVQFPTSTTGYVVGAGTVIKTANGGTTWTSQTVPFAVMLTVFSSVYFTDANNGCAVGSSGVIIKTTNGGTTWTQKTSGVTATLTSVHFPSATIGYAVGSGGTILKTTDGGSTWASKTSGVSEILRSVNFITNDKGFIAGDSGVIHGTTDGGTTWTHDTVNILKQMVNCVNFSSASVGCAVGNVSMILKYNSLVVPTIIAPSLGATVGVSPTLLWNKVNNATKYRLQISSNVFFTSILQDFYNIDTLKVLSGLSYSSQYYWRIKSVNASDSSDWSLPTYFSTSAVPVVQVPTLLNPANNSLSQAISLQFNWNKSPNATLYRIQVATDSLFTSIIKNETGADSLKNLSAFNYSTLYFWRVRAYTATDSSNWSSVWKFTTQAVPLTAPVLIAPTNLATGVSTLPAYYWNVVTNATSYYLKVALDTNFNNLVFEKNLTNYYYNSIDSLAKNTKYYWQVKGAIGTNYGPWSEIRTFTTTNGVTAKPIPSSWGVAYSNTGYVHTIAFTTTSNPTIGNRAFQNGDAIGFFYTDNGVKKCAGYGIWNGANIAISVWGDNDQTQTVKEGFASNESFYVKVWDAVLGKEYPANVTYSSGYSYYTGNYSIIGSLSAILTKIHAIPLSQGWNWISTYVTPTNLNVDTITSLIRSKVVLMRDGSGQVFWPSLNINTIGSWNIDRGYQIYMSSLDTLKVNGLKIETANSPYIMNSGWNLISYKRDSAMLAPTALATINSNIVIMRNNLGQTYWPSLGINNLGSLQPGFGYQVYLNALDTLTYPTIIKKAENPSETVLKPININTGSLATWAVKTNLENGYEIAAINNSGEILGVGKVNNGLALVTVWGENHLIVEMEGAIEGEKLVLKAYNPNSKKFENLSANRIISASGDELKSDLTYNANSAIIIESASTTGIDWTINSNFTSSPNPVSSELTLNYSLEQGGEYSLAIYNSIGELAKTLSNSIKEAGSYNEKFNIDDLSSGVYRLVLTEGNKIQSQNIIILK